MPGLNGFRRWKIRNQIIFSMILMTVLLAVALSLTSYFLFKATIERNYLKTYENNLKVFRDVVDLKLKSAVNLVREGVTDDAFLAIIKADNPSGSKYYSTRAIRSLEDVWAKAEAQDLYLDGVFLFDNQGRYYKRLKGTQSGAAYQKYYSEDLPLSAPWVRQAAAARGREVFFGGDLLAPDGGRQVISYAKQLIDPGTLKPVGFLVVNLREAILRNSLSGNDRNFKTDTLMLLGADGRQVIYSTGDERYAQGVIAGFVTGKNAGRYLYSSVTSTVTGWRLVNGVAKSDLNQMSQYTGMVILVTAVSLMALVALLSFLISRIINRPLRELTGVIGAMREDAPIERDFGQGEIGQVGQALKQAVARNLELRGRLITAGVKEREAELLLLQAQINPHFLYNTLDSIYCRAIIEGSDTIADMVAQLSELFKISLSKGRKVIAIREELDYIEKYMSLLQMRYGDRFSLELDVEDGIRELYMMKFILQPFVENAIYHGLEPKMGKGCVKVSGRREGDELVFTVEDDGVGIECPEDVYKGYGIRNVVDRIHLLYGEEYGIEASSRPGEGTRVTVRIQVMKVEAGE
jgi:two-component system sensor histidine kinase YesM